MIHLCQKQTHYPCICREKLKAHKPKICGECEHFQINGSICRILDLCVKCTDECINIVSLE